MKKHKTSILSRVVFKTVRWLVRLFYGKTEIVGIENMPKKDVIIVANHAQMNGPIIGELFMPDNCYTWCAGEMMCVRDVPRYAFNDFWSHKPKWTRPFFKLLSYIIAPLASCIFNNARTVAVYRDTRVLTTFRETVAMLKDGKIMLIFPEMNETNNNILYKFQENFIDVAKIYHKRTGKEITFVPMYNAPKLKKAYIGRGIRFDITNDIDSERKRIAEYLSNEITDIARSLPRHKVIPYRNVPKKNYVTNEDVTKLPQ